MRESFGTWLKGALKERKMSQRDLASLLETSEVSISRYIHGARMPRMEDVSKIMDIMGCHIEILPNKEG